MDFLAGTRSAFAAATASSPDDTHELWFRFAGHPVRLHVVGSALQHILAQAYGNLALSAAEADDVGPAALTVYAWDRATTDVGCPGIPHAPDTTDVLGPGLMSQYADGQILRYDRSHIVKTIARASSEIFICTRDATKTGLNDRTKPFPHFLATWYHDRGVQLLHAGLVAQDDQGVLLGGTGGSGKSTSSIACALGGLQFLGDDTVGTAIVHDDCIGYACYNAVRSDARNVEWFPQLQAAEHLLPATPADKGKILTYMTDVADARPISAAIIRGIVIPSVKGSGPTHVVPTTGANALRRLAPSTLLRGLGGGVAGFKHMAELTRRLPCYELLLGASVADVPDAVQGLLEEISA